MVRQGERGQGMLKCHRCNRNFFDARAEDLKKLWTCPYCGVRSDEEEDILTQHTKIDLSDEPELVQTIARLAKTKGISFEEMFDRVVKIGLEYAVRKHNLEAAEDLKKYIEENSKEEPEGGEPTSPL
jgi:hypothetical protein